MNQKDDGGQAFPGLDFSQGNVPMHSHGMTLRDWFAGKALGNYDIYPEDMVRPHDDQEGPAEIAAWCYTIADAMLAARKQD